MLSRRTKKGKRWCQWWGAEHKGHREEGSVNTLCLYVAWLLVSFYHWIISHCIDVLQCAYAINYWRNSWLYGFGQLGINFCKTHVPVFRWTSVFKSAGWIPSSITVGSCGKTMTGFLRDCQSVFQSDCNTLHPSSEDGSGVAPCRPQWRVSPTLVWILSVPIGVSCISLLF